VLKFEKKKSGAKVRNFRQECGAYWDRDRLLEWGGTKAVSRETKKTETKIVIKNTF
jgi:hypothetical protein